MSRAGTSIHRYLAARIARATATLAIAACAALAAAPAQAATAVTRLEARIVTGAQGVPADSVVELRIREAGRAERRLTLSRGEAWPAGSTHVVPLPLSEPLDPDAVARFGIWFRPPASAPTAIWEIESAEVYALGAAGRVRLLDATVSGLLRRDGELVTRERAASSLTCIADADCDDGRSCNGRERCEPSSRSANARGCVHGTPVACPTNQVCLEGQGCRGLDGAARGGDAGARADAVAAPMTPARGAPVADPPPATQTCAGKDVLLIEADGRSRPATCPSGTACVAQPNGTGVCVPGR